jgi:hypothetical protein
MCFTTKIDQEAKKLEKRFDVAEVSPEIKHQPWFMLFISPKHLLSPMKI